MGLWDTMLNVGEGLAGSLLPGLGSGLVDIGGNLLGNLFGLDKLGQSNSNAQNDRVMEQYMQNALSLANQSNTNAFGLRGDAARQDIKKYADAFQPNASTMRNYYSSMSDANSMRNLGAIAGTNAINNARTSVGRQTNSILDAVRSNPSAAGGVASQLGSNNNQIFSNMLQQSIQSQMSGLGGANQVASQAGNTLENARAAQWQQRVQPHLNNWDAGLVGSVLSPTSQTQSTQTAASMQRGNHNVLSGLEGGWASLTGDAARSGYRNAYDQWRTQNTNPLIAEVPDLMSIIRGGNGR